MPVAACVLLQFLVLMVLFQHFLTQSDQAQAGKYTVDVISTSVHMQGGADPSGTPPRGGGLAALMRRAVQQAKAEAAAAQVQGPTTVGQEAAGSAQSSKLEQAGKIAGGDKRALGSMLKKAAQKMQQQEAAVQSEKVTAVSASPAATHLGLGSLKPAELEDASSDVVDEAEQPQAQADSIEAADNEQLPAISRASSFGSTVGLLPERPPERKPSLGERLSAVLRGTLSLPRQSSYMAVAGHEDASVAADDLSPVRQRALPRDASYLPEWLNQTLSLSSGNVYQHHDDLETQDGAEDEIELPQWVNWSTMRIKEDTGPGKQWSTPLALLTDGSPPTQLVLESDSDPAVAQTPPTPKGHRLFEFWQQKSAAAAAAASTPVKSPPSPPPLPPAHARHRQLSVQQLAAETLLSSADTRLDTPTAQQQLPSSSDEAAAGLLLPPEGAQAQQHSPSLAHSGVASELAATSRLVQQQSVRQAELMEGLEYALSQLSQHCLLIRHPTAQLELSEMQPCPGMVVATSECCIDHA